MLFKKKKSDEMIIKNILSKTALKRFTQFILGILIVSLTFNILILPYNIVYGVGGIGVMLKNYIDPSLVILISSVFLLILSYIFLGKTKTTSSVIGTFTYPLFVKLTDWIPQYIDIEGVEPLLAIVMGAFLFGFGIGLIFKSGFTTGGTDILNQIVSKYAKMSIGNAMLITDGVIIVVSGLVLGLPVMMYSLISLYIISMMSDKVIIGISQSKAFYVITSHETEVKKFVLSHLSHGVTVIDVRGGFTGNNQKMIMFIVPTKEYFFAKEGIKEIDHKAFFVVTDAYEVSGGE